MIVCNVPGRAALRLEVLLLDANGTLTDRGQPIDGVAERVRALAARAEVRILSADTFGTLRDVARLLGARGERVTTGEAKAAVVAAVGRERCAAIGNGANDAAMLAAAALGIAVVGPEGAAGAAVRAADVVCTSIVDALDLLLDERALAATLRP
ncbi:MAG: HAD family hydrolase [Thermoleophilia bacterium]|nr:HAD family hydrolase [Gaiellaceae bacterium]MDW8338147.1 HAD family hydrolase [Thermoleophilia bacterium]